MRDFVIILGMVLIVGFILMLWGGRLVAVEVCDESECVTHLEERYD